MNRFAALIDALLFTPSRNGKLRLMGEYFATTQDPERGWALAALTGELSFAEAKQMIQSGAADKGMIPKLEACMTALEAGVERAHLIDGRQPHAILIEVYAEL